jgi:hypothetical protein
MSYSRGRMTVDEVLKDSRNKNKDTIQKKLKIKFTNVD